MKGVDYAFYPHPSGTALKSAGVKFVGRYISPEAANDSNGKNLLPAELKALRDAGIAIILYEEQYAARMREGNSAGVADARHFEAVVQALGMTGAIMYAAADWDATEAEQAKINGYLDGVASVIGRARTGIYGGYYVVKRALDAGKATHAVQTVAWSAGQWDARADVRQYLPVSIGGVNCDRLESMKADYGQWPRPAVTKAGAYRHVVPDDYELSLEALAKSRRTTVAHLATVSHAHLSQSEAAAFDAYLALDLAMAAATMPRPAMPEGLVYYTASP